MADQRISEQQLQALDDADEYSLRHHSSEVSLLISSYRDLLGENDRMRDLLAQKLVDSTMLTGLVPDASGINIHLEGGACRLVADAFGEQLYSSGAENYIEAFFSSSKYPDMGQIVVTVKRETGKTPHALRLAAEQEVRRLLAELEALKSQAPRQVFGLNTPCIACGQNHVGMAGLPCPNMTPMAGGPVDA